MNLLFLCHAGLDSNSMGHIAGFARPLAARGHALVVGVPEEADLRGGGDLPGLRIQPATFDRLREEPRAFPDGRGADVVHAWTPREHVRRVAFDVLRRTPGARLVVHLEDNERFLSEALAGESWDGLLALPARALARRLPDRATHPRWGDIFLGLADAVTGITPALRDLVPADQPFLAVRPAVDFTRFHPGPEDPAERAALGTGAGERVVVYTGNSHPGNRTELLALYRAVERLNARGQPTRLLRTGTDTGRVAPEFAAANRAPFVTHLGLVERDRLPGLLRLADALVQPGAPDEFNRYRLPSKLPEFLAVGRPVLLPACNLADELTEGEEALFLRRGTAEEIADGLARVFADPGLARRLGTAASAAARRLFDGEGSAAALAELYADVLHRPPNARLNVLHRGPDASGSRVAGDDDARIADEPALLAGLLRAELTRLPAPPPPERTRAMGQLVDALAAAAVPELRPESPVARCQMFFPVGNLYDEAAAGNLPLGPEGRWRRLTFWWLEPRSGGLHPRVDVADQPGLVDIAAATVRDARDGGRVLWRGRRARDFDRVRVEGDALRLAHPRGLRVFCTGPDPQLYLPPLDPSFIPLDVPVRVTLWVRFCRGPELGVMLARMSERLCLLPERRAQLR